MPTVVSEVKEPVAVVREPTPEVRPATPVKEPLEIPEQPPEEVRPETPPTAASEESVDLDSVPKKEKKERKVVVKKERKQREPPAPKTRRESVKEVIIEEPEPKEKTMTPEPEREPTPEPEVEPEPMIFKEISLPTPPPMRKVAPPPLPRAAPPIPPLPREYTDPDKPKREVSQTLLEAPPPMYEPPKQRRPPPLKRPKVHQRERRLPVIKQSEVPKEQPDPRQVMDPLDYLAKYCIIHNERLPHYEMVFNKVMKEQTYRYGDVPHEVEKPPGDDVTTDQSESDATTTEKASKVKTRLENHEEKMITDMTVINRSTREEFATTGYNIGDQNVQKVNFTLDTLIDRFEEMQEKHDRLQGDRILLMAGIAAKMYPEVMKPGYKGDKKKKKKGKKKKGADSAMVASVLGNTTDTSVQTDGEEVKGALTEVDIVRRLNAKMITEISQDPEISRLNLEIERLQEKLRDIDDRIEDLEDEKKILQLYSRDEFRRDVGKKSKDETMVRRQSALYQKMHPNEDPEMNLNELEDALQQINGHLVTDKELQFIYHILDLKGRRRINRQMFCVVAALSEKVKQVDPFVRKLINKFNYEALNVKMDKSKELFWLLDEECGDVPSGTITATNLAVELAAGGVSPEHTQFVVNKFDREKNGSVDFMDYLTYVPLFIELHDRMVDNPLSDNRVF